jgi:hypothetical protein
MRRSFSSLLRFTLANAAGFQVEIAVRGWIAVKAPAGLVPVERKIQRVVAGHLLLYRREVGGGSAAGKKILLTPVDRARLYWYN